MLCAVSDWNRFLECVPWFVKPGQNVDVGSPGSWARGSLPDLPRLSALLASARVTPVSVAGRSYELLSRDSSGWLCELPQDSDVPPALRGIRSVFDGTVEQFGGPSTLWTDQDEVLTVSAAGTSPADVIAHYEWAWANEGLTVPVEEMRSYVTVAIEGNGNLTAAHRETGRLVLSRLTTSCLTSRRCRVVRSTRCTRSTSCRTLRRGSRRVRSRGRLSPRDRRLRQGVPAFRSA